MLAAGSGASTQYTASWSLLTHSKFKVPFLAWGIACKLDMLHVTEKNGERQVSSRVVSDTAVLNKGLFGYAAPPVCRSL